MTDAPGGYRATIGAASLVVGPTLMSIGDLLHPAEAADAVAQVAIVAESAPFWYAAHVLLFIGLLTFVPGMLALSQLTSERSPAAGYAARLLLLASVGALSAVFVMEMFLGRLIFEGGDLGTAVELLETFRSSAVFLVLAPGLLAFFAGIALFAVPLVSAAGPYQWPALGFLVGAGLIMGEIALVEVLLSQIGIVVMLISCVVFARNLLRGDAEPGASALTPDSGAPRGEADR